MGKECVNFAKFCSALLHFSQAKNWLNLNLTFCPYYRESFKELYLVYKDCLEWAISLARLLTCSKNTKSIIFKAMVHVLHLTRSSCELNAAHNSSTNLTRKSGFIDGLSNGEKDCFSGSVVFIQDNIVGHVKLS